jgi:hypothetical protein
MVRFALESLKSQPEAFDITAETPMMVCPLLAVHVKLEKPSNHRPQSWGQSYYRSEKYKGHFYL